MDFVEANDVMLPMRFLRRVAPPRAAADFDAWLGTQMIQWHRPLIDSFTAQGMDVVIFDNRDVGRSTKLDAAGIPDFSALAAAASVGTMFPVPYTLDDMARDVVGLMDGLICPRPIFSASPWAAWWRNISPFLTPTGSSILFASCRVRRPGRAATR